MGIQLQLTLAVAVGGALGTLTRTVLILVLPGALEFPFPTLIVNIVGSFALGAVLAWHQRKVLNPFWLNGLGAGFCGSLTTFSAVSAELMQFWQQGALGMFGLYLAALLLPGLGAVMLAFRLFAPAPRSYS